MPKTPTVLLFAALLAASPAWSAREPLTSVPLAWRPTVARDALALPAIDAARFRKVRIRIDTFADARGVDPASLGAAPDPGAPRAMPADPEPPAAAPVAAPAPTTPDDVAAFVTDRFIAQLGELGLPVVDDRVLRAMGADVVDRTVTISRLAGAVTRFSLAVDDSLHAEVRLQVSVLDRQGRGIWTGTSGGKAGRIARSYKLADAQEALSEALQEAIAQLLRSPDFVTALEGRK
jgi:hypothetical protein